MGFRRIRVTTALPDECECPQCNPTVAEQFNQRMFCGDHKQHGYPVKSFDRMNESFYSRGCGARNWRVFRFALGLHLRCKECGLDYLVALDPWPVGML